MKNFLLLLMLILIVSCNREKTSITKEKVNIKQTVDTVNDTKSGSVFSNPVLIYGSSFGNYFQTLYRLGQFEDMIKFTHSKSIEKNGREAIMNHYKKMKFNFDINLASQNKINDSTYVLNYNSNVIATKKLLRITVGIENDSCKLILPEKLKDFPD